MPAPSVRYPGTFLAKPERLETLDCPTMQSAQFQHLMGRKYLEAAAARYAGGCPKCGAIPCACPFGP
jgi:hypothetical protein